MDPTGHRAVVTAPAAPRAGRREWIGLAVLTLACLLYAMDLTVLYLAVPSFSAELQPSSPQLLWITDIYGFMFAGFLVTMGTLGDRIGRRRLLLLGAAAFGLVSILAALSTSPGQLIAARALLGIAGATLAPSTLSLIFAMFPDPQRARAIGVWIAAFSAGGAIGPLLGGVLLERFWWGSVFLLALPVMALLLVLGSRVLPEYRDPQAGRLDLVSAAMSLVAVLAVVFGLKQVAQDGLGGLAVAAVVVGLAVGLGFARRQLRLADPMIDLRLFRTTVFNAALATNFLGIFIAVGYFLFVAQYLQLVLGLSPLQVGLWSLPSAVGFIAGSNLAPKILRRVRPAYVIGAGLGLAAVGLGVLTRVGGSHDADLAILVGASLVVSLGLAPVFGSTTDLIVSSAPPQRAGAASGISETVPSWAVRWGSRSLDQGPDLPGDVGTHRGFLDQQVGVGGDAVQVVQAPLPRRHPRIVLSAEDRGGHEIPAGKPPPVPALPNRPVRDRSWQEQRGAAGHRASSAAGPGSASCSSGMSRRLVRPIRSPSAPGAAGRCETASSRRCRRSSSTAAWAWRARSGQPSGTTVAGLWSPAGFSGWPGNLAGRSAAAASPCATSLAWCLFCCLLICPGHWPTGTWAPRSFSSNGRSSVSDLGRRPCALASRSRSLTRASLKEGTSPSAGRPVQRSSCH
jgi:MFS transporter, DHA2 family, multidrug resistance protein